MFILNFVVGNELCMGKCINTLGSFLCNCPVGYEVQADNITCKGINCKIINFSFKRYVCFKDIDECLVNPNLCLNNNELCINTLGSFKCQHIECPKNYIRDIQHKK